MFDPIGWLALVVITAKIFLQKLWAVKCNWDDDLPTTLFPVWRSYYESLPLLRAIAIPRWTGTGPDCFKAELDGFADASTVAYGAVIYLKLTKMDNSVQIALLFAKAKIAPLKPVSVPRLELCATVLLARTMAFLRPLLNHHHVDCYCWTDSTVALDWLSQHPSRWRTFVSNRVHEVQTKLPEAVWQYVSSQQNPVDAVSRGITPSELIESTLWWEGPPWLKLPPSQWLQTSVPGTSNTHIEARNQLPSHLQQVTEEWNLSQRYSSWIKLLRVTAYILRFISRLRARQASLENLTHVSPRGNAKQCPL